MTSQWVHPFRDLVSAGRELATHLEQYADADETIVLGITRGGVPAAIEVANHLRLPLDVIVRRFLLTSAEGKAIGAANVAGALVCDPRVPLPPETPETPLDFFLQDGYRELNERVRLSRGDRPPLEVRDKTVIVVDNGIRSGGTMAIAVRGVRALGAKRIVAASPVGSPEARGAVEDVADETVCVTWTPLGNVAMGYAKFDVPLYEQIAGLLNSR